MNVYSEIDHHYNTIGSSLVWYHNETELSPGGRHNITNSNTTLIITDMKDYDAGSYKVKFFNNCSYPLPSLAYAAPVTFTVQENSVPVYNPLATIPTYYLTVNSTVVLNLPVVDAHVQQYTYNHTPYWYRSDGIQTGIGKESMMSLSVQTTDDNIGVYIGLIMARYKTSFNIIHHYYCRLAYYNFYHNNTDYYYNALQNNSNPVRLSLWNIKIYGMLHQNKNIVHS